MENTKKISRLSIDLTPSQHKQIKLMAVLIPPLFTVAIPQPGL
jgi:hypothetical protein